MDLVRWQQLSFAEQLGNISSEISRAHHWETQHDSSGRNKSLERVLELLDLTLADKRHSARLTEIARLREVVADIFADANHYRVTLAEIQDFLMPFAFLARSQHQ